MFFPHQSVSSKAIQNTLPMCCKYFIGFPTKRVCSVISLKLCYSYTWKFHRELEYFWCNKFALIKCKINKKSYRFIGIRISLLNIKGNINQCCLGNFTRIPAFKKPRTFLTK